jgi:hypothetical protein
MTKLLPTLLLAVFLLTPVAGMARDPVSPTRAHEIVVEESEQNRARARRSAEHRLSSIELPPAAEMSRDRPTGIGDLLSEPIAIPGGRPHATAHRFWTVPVPAHDVLSWLRRHAQPETKEVAELFGTRGRSLEFETLPGPHGRTGGLLFITVVPRSTGGSAVRADVFESWEIPRSPLQRIPAGSRFLHLSISPGSEGSYSEGEKVPPSRTISTEGRSLVAKLVRIVNRQAAYQEVDLASCGSVLSPGRQPHLVTLVFKTGRRGRVLARVSQETPIGICDSLQLRVGTRDPYALDGGWDVLRAARGLIRRARPG